MTPARDPDDEIPDSLSKLYSLLRRASFSECSNAEALKHLARLIDRAGVERYRAGLLLALERLEELAERDLPAEEEALLHYFWANAIEAKRRLERQGWELYAWEQPELEEQIVHLRMALESGERGTLSDRRRAQVLTNLGNALSHCGRLVDAIRAFDQALESVPNHGMAMMNRGDALLRYSRLQPRTRDQRVLGITSFCELHNSLNYDLTPEARRHAKGLVQQFQTHNPGVNPSDGPPLHDHSLGESDEEEQYRRWVLERRLFLNPLNELGDVSMAAEDPLTLPGVRGEIGDGPYPHSFFSQLKQEYASARYLLYESSSSSGPHYSDRHVSVVDTLDRPAFSLRAEKMKAAYRAAYSLLDKIGFFVNDYFEIGLGEWKVNFKTIWFETRNREQIRPEFKDRDHNRPLQGLFWLSKDLYEREAEGFDRPLDPRGKEIWDLRNALEHRYVKLLRREFPEADLRDEPPLGDDRLARQISIQEFEDLTVHLFRLTRAGMINLHLAVYVEELQKAEEEGDEGVFTRSVRTLPFEERR